MGINLVNKRLKDLIKVDKDYTLAALIKLASLQTEDEQYSRATVHDNRIGFNWYDADNCSSMAEYYHKKGYLSEKQIAFLQKTLPKYADQLNRLGGIQPLVCHLGTKPRKTIEPSKKEPDNTVIKSGSGIVISFRYDVLMVSRIKTEIEGRKWNPTKKLWTAFLNLSNLDKLESWNFFIHPELREWRARKEVQNEIDYDLKVPGLQRKLYRFQRHGVAFIESRDGRALVGDEMGLGKTAQALAWLHLRKEARPAIIICPASLKLNWRREIKMWMGKTRSVIVQSKSASVKDIDGAELIIINYDILESWIDVLKKVGPKVVIMDEVHAIKNKKAKRSKAVRALCKGIHHIIGLSGTPIVNRPVELFNAINIIAPEDFPDFWDYATKYCNPVNNGYGWDFNGSNNTEELHNKLTNTVMIRRLKKDVMKQLPPKVRSVVPLEIDNRKVYDEASVDLVGWLKKTVGADKAKSAEEMEQLVRIEALKQLAAEGKMRQAINWIKEFLESEQKLIVFTTHHATIDRLQSEFKDICVKLDGRDSLTHRQASVDLFQNNSATRLFLGNIKAAGVGLTLTAASSVAFLELGWSPGEHQQAEDRPHRIGQEADSVNSYYLIAENTIDEDIVEILDEKFKVLSAVLDGKTIVDKGSLLRELLLKLKR